LYHTEEAAIGGHAKARHNLGCREANNGNAERAAKHWIIAAGLGCDHSLEALRQAYVKGLARHEDIFNALRAHQDAVVAMQSPQREKAEAFLAAAAAIEAESAFDGTEAD
jgi:hypothetical protein